MYYCFECQWNGSRSVSGSSDIYGELNIEESEDLSNITYTCYECGEEVSDTPLDLILADAQQYNRELFNRLTNVRVYANSITSTRTSTGEPEARIDKLKEL